MPLASLPLWIYFAPAIGLCLLLSLIFLAFALYRKRTSPKTATAQPTSIAQETILEQNTAPASPRVVRQVLTLTAKERLPLRDYRLLEEKIQSRLQELKKKYLPFFTYRQQQVQLFFLEYNVDEDLDQLLEYWQAGYRNPQFALLLACYSEAKQQSSRTSFLLQVAAFKKISPLPLSYIHFLFQNYLSCPKSVSELTPLGESALDFSLKIALGKERISRQEYHQFVKSYPLPKAVDFLSALQQVATLPLVWELYRRENITTHIPSLLFKQFLKSGHLHYPQLWLDGSLHPALKLPTNKEETNELIHELLRHSSEGRLLAFLILRYAKSKRELYEVVEPDSAEVSRLESQKSNLPDSLRLAAFLNLSASGFHAAAEDFLPLTVPGRSSLAVRLHRARNWYRLGKYQESHKLIEELLQDYPENLPVLNEAAIYNFKLGNMARAEELFAKMKFLFPDHPDVLYNEALFFEHKHLGEIKQRWQQVEQQKQTGFTAGL